MRGELMAAPMVSGLAPRAGCEIDASPLPDYVARSFEAGGFFPAPMSRAPQDRRQSDPASFCVSWAGFERRPK